MLVPEALRYQTYKTCTLALVGQIRRVNVASGINKAHFAGLFPSP